VFFRVPACETPSLGPNHENLRTEGLFLIGAPKSPGFSGKVGITSFSVHPKTPILGSSVWLLLAILTILREIDLHFSVLRADRHTTETHTDTNLQRTPHLRSYRSEIATNLLARRAIPTN
jgi:hypothetical protein